MPDYDGKLIHSCRDAEGVIDVVDEPTARSLHFGSQARQTTMFLHDPHALALAYTHCMMTCLLFGEAPRSVLILGLGGGSLVRFLLRHFPECRVEAVEKRLRIIEIARTFFFLPQTPQLQIHLGDAADFLSSAHTDCYDLVLVDLHDSDGMAPVVFRRNFFAACRQRLEAHGIMAINLWSGIREAALKELRKHLDGAFAGQTLYLPVAGKRNCVGLGFGTVLRSAQLGPLKKRAIAMESRFSIAFPDLLKQLVQFNTSMF